MPKLLLIDGNYYVYRSFHAIRELTNSRGEPTNAIYGFMRAARKMLLDLQPEYAGVAWDQGMPLRRTQLQPAYKAQRPEMPPTMRPQIDFLRRVTPLMGLHALACPDTEADDLIASYVDCALPREMEVVIATNDKDLMQLVGDRVRIYSTNKTDLSSAKDPFALLGADEVRAKWGVEPEQIGDVLALTGDSVDNIPGVSGFGIKTAAKWIGQFGSAKALVERAGEIANPKVRDAILAQKDQIIANLEMVRLDRDLDLPVPLEEMKVRTNYPELIKALKECEMRSLLAEIEKESMGQQDFFQ